MIIKNTRTFTGEYSFPGDKSISHRAALLGAISEQRIEIRNYNPGLDCASTLQCLRQLGVSITIENDTVTVHGKGLGGFTRPVETLDAGNSGTTMRLLTGLLAGQKFPSVISGDDSLNSRPMNRIIDPLCRMGARIAATPDQTAPLKISGTPLKGITYTLPVNSAQVKSCIILAGLLATSETTVIEPVQTRNHSELMLGLPVEKTPDGNIIRVTPGKTPRFPDTFTIPGDISGAAFLMAGALICDNGAVTLRNIGINPTRAGILDILKEMGADITVQNRRTVLGEDTADLTVRQSDLKGITIDGDIIPNVIDEIPILAVLGSYASGTFSVRGAGELRVKECDRISAIADNLLRMGAAIEEFPDGFTIKGGKKLNGTTIRTYGDHRIAMAFTIAGLAAEGETIIDNPAAATVSFPGFRDVIGEFTNGTV